MPKIKPPKSRSLLSQAAEDMDAIGLALEPPWFRDPEKLLAAVVRHAKTSPALGRKFIDAAAAYAIDERLGSVMREALTQASSGKRGRTAIPDWHHMMFLSDYDLALNRMPSRDDVITWLASKYSISRPSVENRLSKARRIADSQK